MKKLINGIVEFRKNLTQEHRDLFAKLALGQKPDALFIACSDSRVVPNLFASTNPGDLFVVRNVGNLIPPFKMNSEDVSAQAAIEFAVFNLKISNIIVCGHSECGAIEAIADGKEISSCPHLNAWLKFGEASAKKVRQGHTYDKNLSEKNQISQVNVIQQIEHLSRYPFIQELMKQEKLRLHGWWFDIACADVYCFESSMNRFVLIDEEEAKIILSRLG